MKDLRSQNGLVGNVGVGGGGQAVIPFISSDALRAQLAAQWGYVLATKYALRSGERTFCLRPVLWVTLICCRAVNF